MGPRYFPSPKSIITIPNANLAKSIDRVISNQMRLGRLDLEPFSTEEFKTVIRNRVSMFVKGMQTSILNICLLWKTVLSRKPKFNLGLIPIIEPTYPDIPRKNALLNLMAAISRGNIRGWEKEFEYLCQLAQRDPPRRSIFERNMGYRVVDQENLSDAIHIYRFFHECRLIIVESFKEVRLPDITSQAKRQATVKVQTAFTNILCKLRQFRATFRIQPARDVQEFRNLPAAAQLLLLNNDEPVNRRWEMVPQFKSNVSICMVEFSIFRFLTNPIGENLPEGVPDATRELRRKFRKPTNSTFDTKRKGQLFEILMGQRLVMQGGNSESRGSLETDGRNAWYWYETKKKRLFLQFIRNCIL